MQTSYKCLKCENTDFEKGEMRATGSFWTKVFNIQNLKFTSITCKNCGYTEFYKSTKASTSSNVFDFLMG